MTYYREDQLAGLPALSISESREALIKQIDPETIEALARFLTSRVQQEPPGRSVVLDTLEVLRKSTLLNASMKTLEDSDTPWHATASEALGKFRDHALHELALALIDALTDDEWIVRATAVQALGELGEYVPLNLLDTILKNDEDHLVRTAAVRAIGGLKENASLELLISALNDYEWSVREMAILMLGEFGGLVPLKPLVKALDDKDESVREAAVWALGQLGEQAPIEPLLKALRDREASVCEAAARALWKLGRYAQEELLIAAFLDETGSIAPTLDEVIGEVGEFTLAKLLESALTRGVRVPSEIPLLSLLQELLAQDLIKSNEMESPLWQWCTSLSNNLPDNGKANPQAIPVEHKPGTIILFRLRDHLLQNRADRKEKGHNSASAT